VAGGQGGGGGDAAQQHITEDGQPTRNVING
jgi:hypothetical protein